MAKLELEAELAMLADLSWAELRARWSALTGGPAPKVRPGLLRMALAWEMQASLYGGLARPARQRLAELAGGKTPSMAAAPGMRLVREWNGVLHVVTIAEDGSVQWNDKAWNSLSEAARAITGTRWSGPAFFGLKPRRKAA